MTSSGKTCTKCAQEFQITGEDQIFYDQISVPPPKTCPKCRLQRRLLERNTRNLYYRKCDFTGEKIISQYHEGVPFPVYKPDIWWSDKWDAMDYGMDFDFSRPFFDQFRELKNSVPHQGLYVISGTMENSDYTNCTGYLKNCYLIFESDYNEDSYYSNLLKNCKDVMDCSVCYGSELCYECIDCMDCYNTHYSQDCQNCHDSFFLKDCSGCSDCIGCINQRNKKYMIFNKQYTKEQYEKIKAEMALGSARGVQEARKKAEEFFAAQIRKPLHQENNQNCFGDHLYNSKNSFFCFDSKDLEDCKYCVKVSLGIKSSMDYNSWGDKAELIYQTASCGDNIYNLKFCTTCTTNLSDCQYSDQCTKSSHLFGCVGLKNKKYCILNKQYTREQYESLLPRIIDHMKETGEYGEFFPADICPFGYNETIAMTYFPFTKEQAIKQGFKWTDKPVFSRYRGPVTEVPDSAEDLKEDITKFILACSARGDNNKICQKNYKIIAREFAFYKKLQIPAPKKCPDCRYESRMKKRPPLNIWKRKCAKCNEEIRTTYSPDPASAGPRYGGGRSLTVYCEKCYLKEVY